MTSITEGDIESLDITWQFRLGFVEWIVLY
jgi:hypothetical protein